MVKDEGSLACFSPGGCQEADMTAPLNNNSNAQNETKQKIKTKPLKIL